MIPSPKSLSVQSCPQWTPVAPVPKRSDTILGMDKPGKTVLWLLMSCRYLPISEELDQSDHLFLPLVLSFPN